jgi:PmbA protein
LTDSEPQLKSSIKALAKDSSPEVETERLQSIVAQVLERARSRGADAAEVGASVHQGLSVTVRLGEVETLEHSRDTGLGITVYIDQRKGSASSADLSEASIETSVRMACEIARFTEQDPCAGLADADQMATDFPDLDLWHPRSLDAGEAIEIATAMERAALDHDPLIRNSEGGTVDTGFALSAYGNTHGFAGSRRGTRHTLSCVVLAQDEDSMQRDYWYDTRRAWSDLAGAEDIGQRAAERAVRRHGASGIKTCEVPVLYSPEAARSLLGHLVSAISGGNLYRKSSFLLDHLGQQVFPTFVQIEERPFEPRGLRSGSYDNEGVVTRERALVRDGVLNGYVLSSYSARKLKMQTTGNAGGTHNLTLVGGDADFEQLVRQMDRGLVVTELMGQGVNVVTGDYSRGASGFWVEKGKLVHPVEGVTVAGNLRDLFARIVAVGSDLDYRAGIRSGSILIERMTVAGE